MKTVLHIVGNRPQFIKLWVLHQQLATDPGIRQLIIHSGQHYSDNMSGVFFETLQIPAPDHHLHIANNLHTDSFIAACSSALQLTFREHPHAIVFLYGDTNTTLAGALAAARCGNTIHHFEAGVRTGENTMPEEINRILSDRLAQVNYCCTRQNYNTMHEEGYGAAIRGQVHLTGDLMLDAYLAINKGLAKPETGNYIAATIHRAGNITNPDSLLEIINGLNQINSSIPVKLVLHPHTKKRLEEFELVPRFELLPPMDYLEMTRFVQASKYVITDSGGVSREAFFAQKRSVVVMENPFWPEIIEAGCSVKALPDAPAISAAFKALDQLHPYFEQPVFGNGDAAKKIHAIIAGQDLKTNHIVT